MIGANVIDVFKLGSCVFIQRKLTHTFQCIITTKPDKRQTIKRTIIKNFSKGKIFLYYQQSVEVKHIY